MHADDYRHQIAGLKMEIHRLEQVIEQLKADRAEQAQEFGRYDDYTERLVAWLQDLQARNRVLVAENDELRQMFVEKGMKA